MISSGNNTISSDFLRVLMALKKNTMKDNNVAEVAKISSISSGKITCTLLSNSKTFIYCEALKDLDVQVNDVVLIIFTNTDFRQNLNRIKNNQQPIDNSNEILHSLNYGIIVGIVYRKILEE